MMNVYRLLWNTPDTVISVPEERNPSHLETSDDVNGSGFRFLWWFMDDVPTGGIWVSGVVGKIQQCN